MTVAADARSHTLHTARVPRNTSRAASDTISRQKGHSATTASHSSVHVQPRASLTMHPQHKGWEQQRACMRLRGHFSAGQNACAQMKHALSSDSSCLSRLCGRGTSITTVP